MQYDDDLTEVSQRTNDIVQFVQENVLLPSMEKEPIRYHIGDAAAMVGKSQQSLKNKDDIGRPQKTPYGTVERREYFIDDINRLRDHFKTRKTFDRSTILAVGSYKGGVSKSTCTQHIAHYFATQGYRVLVVDTDPQASTTQQLLGVVPDIAIAPEQTLAPLLTAGRDGSKTIDPDTQILATNWPTVDIIPAQMALLDAEGLARFENIKLNVFADPLMDVAQDYDLVVIDTPPSSSYLTISSFISCDVLLVPSPPRWMDLCSTASFFNLCRHHLVDRLEYKDLIVRIVPSLVYRAASSESPDSVERSIMEYMRVGLGPWMLDCELLHSSTTQRLASSYRTLYEPDSRDAAWRRAISGFERLGEQLEDLFTSIQAEYAEEEES